MTNSKIKINLDSLKTRRDWKRHKVKDGHNVFRVLPPFGESSNGYPYRKWQIIWGLMDPETGRKRPYASSLISEKKCPVVEFVDSLKEKAENIKLSLQNDNLTEEEIRDRLSALNAVIADLSPKTVYVYNAADQSGEVGLLELKSTAHKKMKAEMNQYVQDYNQDPTSLNSDDDDSGLWFDVIRTGEFRDTEYDVKKRQLKTKNPQTGKISFEDDRSPLPDSVVQNYDNLAYDLSAVYQIKTYDELAEILAANMDRLAEECTDLNTNSITVNDDGSVAVDSKTGVVKISTSTPVSTKTIITRLNDEEDIDVPVKTAGKPVVKSVATSRAVKATNQVDDDFMREADELLNS